MVDRLLLYTFEIHQRERGKTCATSNREEVGCTQKSTCGCLLGNSEGGLHYVIVHSWHLSTPPLALSAMMRCNHRVATPPCSQPVPFSYCLRYFHEEQLSQLDCFSSHDLLQTANVGVFAEGCATTPTYVIASPVSRRAARVRVCRTSVCFAKPTDIMLNVCHRDRRLCTDRRLDTLVRKKTTTRCAKTPILGYGNSRVCERESHGDAEMHTSMYL